jgi:hypothetical protein
MRALCRLAFCSLLLLATSLFAPAPASADSLCRTVMPDGRVFFTRPIIGGNQLFCRDLSRAPSTTNFAALPFVRFTTGEIGPLTTPIGPVTTGQIGPFTTGSIGPLTTFTNSAPATLHR